eukprot:1113017-Pleurochrysis_carterae.AAC.1
MGGPRHRGPGGRGRGGDEGGVRFDDGAGLSSPRAGGAGGGGGEGGGGGHKGGVGVAPRAPPPIRALPLAAARRHFAGSAEGARARRWLVRGGGLRQAP